MIVKIQRPIVPTNEDVYYLIYNKDRSIISHLAVGQVKEIDAMFNIDEYKIYAKGYIDKKGNLVINRRVENQNW